MGRQVRYHVFPPDPEGSHGPSRVPAWHSAGPRGISLRGTRYSKGTTTKNPVGIPTIDLMGLHGSSHTNSHDGKSTTSVGTPGESTAVDWRYNTL